MLIESGYGNEAPPSMNRHRLLPSNAVLQINLNSEVEGGAWEVPHLRRSVLFHSSIPT